MQQVRMDFVHARYRDNHYTHTYTNATTSMHTCLLAWKKLHKAYHKHKNRSHVFMLVQHIQHASIRSKKHGLHTCSRVTLSYALPSLNRLRVILLITFPTQTCAASNSPEHISNSDMRSERLRCAAWTGVLTHELRGTPRYCSVSRANLSWGMHRNWPTIPQLYIKGEFIGGCDIMMELHESGELKKMIEEAGAVHK